MLDTDCLQEISNFNSGSNGLSTVYGKISYNSCMQAEDLEKALKQANLMKVFQALAPSHQREYIQWIDQAKKSKTRATRIAKMCKILHAQSK